ncbi:hypothetical protein NDU88_002518 [Pleurodeles waltl]|uniref:Uncharacterized protein n=1 Tax=Pleurodeles waltl TaxID=8319 RepID=A0AAV7SC76_PLEWA|nr:hypothetical protein NDU88_002518 [Pleurodeles waltl]
MGNDLKHFLSSKQHNPTKIDGKINALSLHMDRMSERLDMHAKHLDMVERSLLEVEDEQVTAAASQKGGENALFLIGPESLITL